MKKKELCPYVSRGGLKLENALKVFKPKLKGKIAIDVGASTGGFTDCLLQHGVSKVYAIDVSYGQLAWKLRKDPRVVPVERTNIRYLTPEKLYTLEPANKLRGSKYADLATIDVSFISLSKVLPAVKNLLSEKGEVIALIKPQFEAGREEVPKGGVVKDRKIHEKVLEQVAESAQALGFKVLNFTPSPIAGADGNIEFFIYLTKDQKRKGLAEISNKIKKVIAQAYEI